MPEFFIAPEGFPLILAGLALTAVGWLICPWLAIPFALLTLFVIFFFRNPRRTGPDLPDALISPADGKVMAVKQVEQSELNGEPAVIITIFLSLLNVHINRAPMTGTVTARNYRPGQYLPAFKTHASDLNERNSIQITADAARPNDARRSILVHQITGFLARRIVCDVNPGAQLRQRQRFGLIRFGSCTELVCPADVQVRVQPGDRVRGGLDILAEFPPSAETVKAPPSLEKPPHADNASPEHTEENTHVA